MYKIIILETIILTSVIFIKWNKDQSQSILQSVRLISVSPKSGS